jgi:hypothetical protein
MRMRLGLAALAGPLRLLAQTEAALSLAGLPLKAEVRQADSADLLAAICHQVAGFLVVHMPLAASLVVLVDLAAHLLRVLEDLRLIFRRLVEIK